MIDGETVLLGDTVRVLLDVRVLLGVIVAEFVAVGVFVRVFVGVRLDVCVAVYVAVSVYVGDAVRVRLDVRVYDGVRVNVLERVGVDERVNDGVRVNVLLGVYVKVNVGVFDGVNEGVNVNVGVGDGVSDGVGVSDCCVKVIIEEPTRLFIPELMLDTLPPVNVAVPAVGRPTLTETTQFEKPSRLTPATSMIEPLVMVVVPPQKSSTSVTYSGLGNVKRKPCPVTCVEKVLDNEMSSCPSLSTD